MRTVSSSESIIDVAVCVGCQLLGESFLAFLDSLLCSGLFFIGSIFCKSTGLAFFLGIVTKVLEKERFAGF